MKKLTRLDVLKNAYDSACDNLLFYSANYAMSSPKAGYESEWSAISEEVEVLGSWIKELEEVG